MKTTITTTTSINPSSIPPKILFPERFHNTLFSIKFPRNPPFVVPKSGVAVKCSNNGSPGNGDGGSLKDVLSGMVDERVEELLKKEENRGLLDGLEQASRRVEMAKRELAEIEKQEMEAKKMRDYINQLESRASEIAECQKEILEARVMVEEAERSLTQGDTDTLTETESEVRNKDEERLESIKAASIAAIIGTLAELPFSLSRVGGNSQLILPLAITFVSCALFGVTFRYAIRRDLDNFQLKTGTSAAFGFVKGLGMVGGGPPLELETSSILTHAFDGAVYVSESLLIFLFAGVALDFCIKSRILSPFPIDRSVPRI
ncbi:hypothetical protein BUALT_Bualt05G0090000 [Buddleja alternifolia]|uniref:Homer protein n=1 Tax=Buddleja alternifolia TaxID=168488 RepID=A0AAV6XHW8_9LAMI|nr:hypothetical protein BUALT_Bualt05G0090000 [Buddleja alternifolia]